MSHRSSRRSLAHEDPRNRLSAIRQAAVAEVDPLAWARALRTAERGGLRLSDFQRQAWRAALAQPAPAQSVADQQTSEGRSASPVDAGSTEA